MRAPAITETMRGSGLEEYETRAINIKDPAFGAKGDGVTDDTIAIQKAINVARGERPVYIPGLVNGTDFFMFSNLILPTKTCLIGASRWLSRLKRIAGSVGIGITDEDNANKLRLANFSIYGNGTTGNLIELGFNAVQWGEGKLENLWVRDCTGYGFKLNANAAWMEDIVSYDCSLGVRIASGGNIIRGLQIGMLSTGVVALTVSGERNVFTGTYIEGVYSTAAIQVSGFANGFHGTTWTPAPDDEGASPTMFLIDSDKYGNVFFDTKLLPKTGCSVAMMIIDNSYASQRKVPGYAHGDYDFLEYYRTGRGGYRFLSNTAGPPTTGKWIAGDVADVPAAAYGGAQSFLCSFDGEPGLWKPLTIAAGAIAKTGDYSVLTADNGRRYNNTGAGGVITFSLPSAVIGMEYQFMRLATQDLRIDPDGSQTIRGGGAGKYLQLDADGDSVALISIQNNKWEIMAQVGTPSFEI